MPSLAEIVSGLRNNLGDFKTRDVHLVKEQLGTASGTQPEIFYTENMPVVSGETIGFFADRWKYSLVSSVAAASGVRGFNFDYDQGRYTIPTGAIGPTSGDVIYGTYTYTEDREFVYSDSELYEYAKDGLNFVQSIRDLGITILGYGTSSSFSPNPDNISTFLIKMATKYLIRKDEEQLGLSEGLYISELDITIDTTKGAGNRTISSSDLKNALVNILDRLNMGDTAAAGALIDTYSTWVSTDVVGLYYEQNENDGEKGLGVGIV